MKTARKKVSAGTLFERFGIVLILILICLVLSILSPSFLSIKNFVNVFRQVSMTGIIAVGMVFVIVTGGIDLSVGSITGVVAMISTSLAHPGQFPLFVPVLAGLLAGTAAGALNGIIIAYGDVPPFITTLGMMTSLRGLALLYNNGRPIIDLSEEYTAIGGGMLFGEIPYPVVIFLIVIVVGVLFLRYSKFGRHVYAVGGNEQSAKVSGINVKRVKLIVYMIAGFVSALSGIIISSRVMTGSPSAGEGYEMDAITACVIGGASLSGGEGSVVSTVIGALIVVVLNNGLDLLKVSSYWQQIVKGIIIIAAVLIDIKTKAAKRK